MRMNINEAGCNDLAASIDFLGPGLTNLADFDNHTVTNTDIGLEWFCTTTVIDRAPSDYDVHPESSRSSLALPNGCASDFLRVQRGGFNPALWSAR